MRPIPYPAEFDADRLSRLLEPALRYRAALQADRFLPVGQRQAFTGAALDEVKASYRRLVAGLGLDNADIALLATALFGLTAVAEGGCRVSGADQRWRDAWAHAEDCMACCAEAVRAERAAAERESAA